MNRRYALGLLGAAAVTAGGLSLFPRTSGLGEIGAAFADEAATADPSSVMEMALGAADAPVTLMEYASFTCPHCASFHNNVMGRIKAEYVDSGKVRFVYRDVYFDRPGLWAAMIARCDPNRFFGIANMLYKDQKDWIGDGDLAGIEQNLRKLGLVAGLSQAQLDQCLSDAGKAQALYAWFQTNVEADGITGTPTLFVDSEKHSNMSYDELKKILDAKLGL